MKKQRVLGIYRNPRFSNNAVEVDRLILEESMAQLRAKASHPLELEMLEEDEAPAGARGSYDLVLSMAQASETLDALDRSLAGSPVWNSQAAIRNCYRKNMSRILGTLSVGYAPYITMSSSEPSPAFAEGDGFWLKRSDFHAIADEDVTLAESAAEFESKLCRFRERGVGEIIVQRHIHGDIYKFYGVQGGGFFRAIRVRDFLRAKEPPAAALTQLESSAFRAAAALGVVVFGGDAILDAQGRFHLIDLNDWPSFRICRPEAAAAIGTAAARLLESRESAPGTSASAHRSPSRALA